MLPVQKKPSCDHTGRGFGAAITYRGFMCENTARAPEVTTQGETFEGNKSTYETKVNLEMIGVYPYLCKKNYSAGLSRATLLLRFASSQAV